MRHATTTLLLTVSLLLPDPAWAANDSWFTAGFALHGVRSSNPDAASPFGRGVNMGWQVRLRIFRALHLQFDYNTTRVEGQGTTAINTPQSLIREPKHSLTLALDLAHTVVGTPYILAGVGQGEEAEGFDGTVLFAGVGYELPFATNWALAAEARFLAPSVQDVRTYISREQKQKTVMGSEIPTLSDFYNTANYQILFALRYYF